MRQPRRARNGPRRSLYHDQRGMVLVFVGMGLLAFLSATMLALDVGMFMVARTQAQTAADAGALAGAVSLVFDDFDDRSASGPAVQNAVVAAQSNQVMSQAVSVTPADVTFPTQERVRVDVYRTSGRANAVSTLIAPMFGFSNRRHPSHSDGRRGGRPTRPPASSRGPFPTNGSSNRHHRGTRLIRSPPSMSPGPRKGTPLPNPDIYESAGQPGYTGNQQSQSGPDYGAQLVLKHGNPRQARQRQSLLPDRAGTERRRGLVRAEHPWVLA